MVLIMDWKTARMELRIAVKAPKMEEMKFPMESMREGILAGLVLLGFIRSNSCWWREDIEYLLPFFKEWFFGGVKL